MSQPDLIETSGREDLSLDDRINLLRADLLELKRNAPKYDPNTAHLEARIYGGSIAHEFGCMMGFCDGVVRLLDRDGEREKTRENLSLAECDAMAWKRGGVAEYKRVRVEQRARERARKS